MRCTLTTDLSSNPVPEINLQLITSLVDPGPKGLDAVARPVSKTPAFRPNGVCVVLADDNLLSDCIRLSLQRQDTGTGPHSSATRRPLSSSVTITTTITPSCDAGEIAYRSFTSLF